MLVGGEGGIAVAHGPGDRTFGPALLASGIAGALAVADFDGDGNVDVRRAASVRRSLDSRADGATRFLRASRRLFGSTTGPAAIPFTDEAHPEAWTPSSSARGSVRPISAIELAFVSPGSTRAPSP